MYGKKLALTYLAGLGLLALAGAAIGQVNTVPQVGVITAFSNSSPKLTYSAAFIGLVPPASATDTICLAGSATKTVKITRIELSGSAGTLVTLPITMLMRVSADTGGTAASTTANPANTIRGNDSTNATATATPVSYTAVPTIGDTSPTYVRSKSLTLNVTSAAGPNNALEWNFAPSLGANTQAIVLRGAAQQMCLNFNTISISSGVLNGSLEWTEE